MESAGREPEFFCGRAVILTLRGSSQENFSGIDSRPGVDAKQVVVFNANDRLRVTWGDGLVTEHNGRFIPRGNAVCAYNLSGCQRVWHNHVERV